MRSLVRGFAAGIVVALAAYGSVGCGSAPDAHTEDALSLGTVVFQSTLTPTGWNGTVEQVPGRTQQAEHVLDGTFANWDISGATATVSRPLFWAANEFVITLKAGATPWPHYGINCTLYPRATYPGVDWQGIGVIPSMWAAGQPGLNFAGVYGASYQVPLGRNSRNSRSTCSDEGGGWLDIEPIEVLVEYVPVPGRTNLAPNVPTKSTTQGLILRIDVPIDNVINRYFLAVSK